MLDLETLGSWPIMLDFSLDVVWIQEINHQLE